MSTHSTPTPSIAVALHYDGETAPRVTASGRGEVADAICRIAAAHGVPRREEPQLAVGLSQIEFGEEVPAALYRAVAEVIACLPDRRHRAEIALGTWRCRPGLTQAAYPHPLLRRVGHQQSLEEEAPCIVAMSSASLRESPHSVTISAATAPRCTMRMACA